MIVLKSGLVRYEKFDSDRVSSFFERGQVYYPPWEEQRYGKIMSGKQSEMLFEVRYLMNRRGFRHGIAMKKKVFNYPIKFIMFFLPRGCFSYSIKILYHKFHHGSIRTILSFTQTFKYFTTPFQKCLILCNPLSRGQGSLFEASLR